MLTEISISKIERNPENPRLYFRQKEMEELTDSIRKHGVQVPIVVYKEGNGFILIDGERRWRSSIKLNKKTIPAIIQEKPDELTNLVLMFNIHALREQWDLLTIALKLPRIKKLIEEKTNRPVKEKELSQETGLSISTIRRCKLLIQLPEHHLDNIRQELKKPKIEQILSEEFYVEMEKALVTVGKKFPALVSSGEAKEEIRNNLINKYKQHTIPNVLEFRKISKIARAETVSADVAKAEQELKRVFFETNYSIESAFDSSVYDRYLERDLQTTIKSLLDDLDEIEFGEEEGDRNLVELLTRLDNKIKSVLGG